MKEYSVKLEISGPAAIWTRPDTGDTPVSYPAPTFAAAKGIFECVLWSQWAEVIPTKVEICRPIVFHNYTTNYGGPLRKSKIIKKGSSYQLIATVLVNVCYRLYAKIVSIPEHYGEHGRPGLQRTGTTNGAHAYQEVFQRRIKKGQLFSIPFLGWQEFTPDYFGAFRSETNTCDDINIMIPSMLKTCFPNGKRSNWEPVYNQGIVIKQGVLQYVK